MALKRNLPEGSRGAIAAYRKNVTNLSRYRTKFNDVLCRKVIDKYEPNGLVMDVPASWDCEKDGRKKLFAKKIRENISYISRL